MMTEKKQIELSDDQLGQVAGGLNKTGAGVMVLSGANLAGGDVNGDGVTAMKCQNNLKQLGLG